MALNFPDNPATNEYFTDNTSGFTYQWNGTVWISVASTQTTSLKEFDDISSSFNSSTTTFSLTFNAGLTKVYPLGVNQITIVIGGILQNAGDDYTVSGDQITFTTAPDAGLTFQGMFYGSSVSMNSVASGSITTSSLSTGGPIWNVGGDVTVAGIVTVGSSSVVIDGPSNEIRVGTGATINASGIVIGGSGIVTATTFYGDGSNLEGVTSGIGTTGSVNTSGIVTASSFTGSGNGLTNIGGQMHAISYSPGIAATGVAATSNIVITFNKPVKANTGTITLKEGAAGGSTVESFDVETSDKITISGGQITIDPTSNFGAGTSFYVAVPAGAYKDILNTSSSPGISTYSFTTVTQNSNLFGVGNNSAGVLGQNDRVTRSSPIQVSGSQWDLNKVNAIAGEHAIVTKTDGTLWAWGDQLNNGALGLNEQNVHRSSPTQIPGTQWTQIMTCRLQSYAIKTDGTFWVWGDNPSGALGLNNQAARSSPQQIPGNWSEVFPGGGNSRHIMAKKSDNTIWSWGYNALGGLGINDNVSRSSPIQLPGTQWNKISTYTYGSMATKTDGSLWTWGYETYGQLGHNQASYRTSSPQQIPGTWASITVNQAGFSGAIKDDGTLWTWGRNTSGQMGHNDRVQYSSPKQVPGSNWNVIESRSAVLMATKTDGTLWVWGGNNGALGINDNVNYSSPVQIPGTWSHVIKGSITAIAFYGKVGS